jgi:hypothetical protein
VLKLIVVRVGLFYRSANFDEEVFTQPEPFDIRRDSNPYLGYGRYGTHYYLRAKLEMGLIFTAIAAAMHGIRPPGDPARLRSGWIHGINQMPVTCRWGYPPAASCEPRQTSPTCGCTGQTTNTCTRAPTATRTWRGGRTGYRNGTRREKTCSSTSTTTAMRMP